VLIIETVHGDRAALALNLEEESIGGLVLGDFYRWRWGHGAPHGDVLPSRVGDELIGRVVDSLGEPLDGWGRIQGRDKTPAQSIEQRAPAFWSANTSTRRCIPASSHRRIDPDRRDSASSSSAIARWERLPWRSMDPNQKNDTGRRTPICIYVAIWAEGIQDRTHRGDVEEVRCVQYSIIVSASAGSPRPLCILRRMRVPRSGVLP